jgi:hypothetical protein
VTARPSLVAARVVMTLLPLAGAAYGLATPHSVLFGGTAWFVTLVCMLAGYGALVERVVGVEVDLGLRMTWGAAVYLALAGLGYAAGVLVHPVILVLIALGLIPYLWRQWTTPRPALLGAWDGLPMLRARPMVTAYFALIAVVAAINVADGIAEVQGNTYDDDVVYTPLVKRTLDVGDIDDPFSFRRISAYGGQTALGALAAARGTLANIYLPDAALFQFVMFALVIGAILRRRTETGDGAGPDGPPIDLVVVGLFLLNLVILPNTTINTGSYWTGTVMFYGLYRTLVLTAPPGAPLKRLFVLVGAVAGATCSLRQNFIPVAVMIPVIVLVTRLGRSPRAAFRSERVLWLATMIGGAVLLIPYCIASYRSNLTFLYPLWPGTFNTNIPTTPTLQTGWQEIQFWFRIILEPEPVRTMVMLLPVIFVARDLRPGKPFTALTIAAIVGFVLLVHAFTLSDARTMWRYAFAYTTPLFFVIVVEGGAAGLRRDADLRGPIQVPLVGRLVILASLLIQIALSARGITRRYELLADDFQAAMATSAHPREELELPLVYGALQAAVPAGKTIAVAVDEPFYLDYARNPIMNLDTPGFASPKPGMPFFQGPEPIAAYLLGQDIRYLGFVRGAFSRYQFRREFWLRRIYLDTEFWRIQGAYAVDCLDNFEALAASRKVLYERDGIVMIDLAERAP